MTNECEDMNNENKVECDDSKDNIVRYCTNSSIDEVAGIWSCVNTVDIGDRIDFEIVDEYLSSTCTQFFIQESVTLHGSTPLFVQFNYTEYNFSIFVVAFFLLVKIKLVDTQQLHLSLEHYYLPCSSLTHKLPLLLSLLVKLIPQL